MAIVAWGTVLACHAAAHDFASLAVCRFLLGVTESVNVPAFTLITGMYYKREEQTARVSLWFGTVGVSQVRFVSVLTMNTHPPNAGPIDSGWRGGMEIGSDRYRVAKPLANTVHHSGCNHHRIRSTLFLYRAQLAQRCLVPYQGRTCGRHATD